MTKRLRILTGAIFVCLFAAATVLLAMSAHARHSEVCCNGLDVIFKDSLGFIDSKDIKDCLDNGYGSYIGQKMDSIALADIERMLLAKGMVKSCEAWTTDNGMLHVAVSQRMPAVLLKDGSTSCYVDRDGFFFPAVKGQPEGVPTVTGTMPFSMGGLIGKLPEEKDAAWLDGLLDLLDALHRSQKWNGAIKSVEIRKDGDIVLVSAEGGERFIFGSPDRIREKLSMMDRYAEKIAPEKEKGYYKSVNLKYNNQIICRKDI